jgi:hypothetical protein
VQAAFAVNRELILLYWSICRDLSQRFAAEEWVVVVFPLLVEKRPFADDYYP